MISSAVATPDGKLLFVAANTRWQNNTPYHADGGWVHVWDMSNPGLKTVISGLGNDLYSVQPTAYGSRFVAISGAIGYATKLEVWDTATKRRLHEFDIPKGHRAQAAASPDGNWVALISWDRENWTLRVWNAETGKPAEEVVKAASPRVTGAVGFTPDSKRLITVTYEDYAEWDLATGKKEVDWKRGKENAVRARPGYAGSVAPLPGGKGVFTIGATGKRRQTYVLGLMTEKKGWFLGEFSDFASTPVVSHDGRWMTLIGGSHDEQLAFLLRLDDDGSPELKDKPVNYWGPVYEGNKVPAWRTWRIARHSWIASFAADGKRLYTGGSTHALQVWDIETQELKATLYIAPPAKPGKPPTDWAIYTPEGHYAASPGGEQVLRFREVTESWFRPLRAPGTTPAADVPHLRNPAKVKEALGVK
jgi:WD40 repeat protein